MLPEISSCAAPTGLAQQKITHKPSITHWIKRSLELFMSKNPNSPTLTPAVAASRARRRRVKVARGTFHKIFRMDVSDQLGSRSHPVITSDNICHVKSKQVKLTA